jgi:hypothetical protein
MPSPRSAEIRPRSDRELLLDAADSAGMPAARFGREVLGVAERTLRYWISGRPFTVDLVRRVLLVGLRHPVLWRWLAEAGQERAHGD